MLTMTIPHRFRGPPNSGNGGYVCGMLARNIAGAAEVTLRAPPPLESALDVVEVSPGQWDLRQGADLVATGRAISLDLARLERATFEEAVEAEKRTPVKPQDHLLPMCFVCGPERAPGDGLRLFADPLSRNDADAVFAVPWMPAPNLAAADGLVGFGVRVVGTGLPHGICMHVRPEDRRLRRFADLTGTPLGSYRRPAASW